LGVYLIGPFSHYLFRIELDGEILDARVTLPENLTSVGSFHQGSVTFKTNDLLEHTWLRRHHSVCDILHEDTPFQLKPWPAFSVEY
jgi:hypothetical protein